MVKDWTPRQLAAEFVATMLFVWVGCGAAVASNRWTESEGLHDAGALVSIGLAFGISAAVLAYSIGHISGGHFNPAVTLAFMLLQLQSVVGGLLYMVAQCLGAICGAFIVWGCNASIAAHCSELETPQLDFANGGTNMTDLAAFYKRYQQSGVCQSSLLPNGTYGPPFGLGVNVVGPLTSNGSAFLLELMGTFFLVFTVLHAAVHTKSTAGNGVPIAIGWSILCCHLQLIPYTGCGINPARSLGPMVVDSIGGMDKWVRGWWVFYTAPFVGSAIATAAYKYIFSVTATPDEVIERRAAAKRKKTDEEEDGGRASAIPQSYAEDSKNTGSERVTEDAVPHAYE